MKRTKLAEPAAYLVGDGAALVKLRDLGPQHRARVVEVREAQTGEGQAGHLVDANHYLFDQTVVIRFEGEREGIFASPDDVVLVHSAGVTVAEVVELYDGRPGS